jgi:hypothetical protein
MQGDDNNVARAILGVASVEALLASLPNARRGDRLIALGKWISQLDEQIKNLREIRRFLRTAWESERDRSRAP